MIPGDLLRVWPFQVGPEMVRHPCLLVWGVWLFRYTGHVSQQLGEGTVGGQFHVTQEYTFARSSDQCLELQWSSFLVDVIFISG